jgi:cobalt/nickel transport system permease protein
MIAEPFAAGNSPIHRSDPRLRLAAAAVFSAAAAPCTELAALSAALFFAALLAALARLEAGAVLKRLVVVNGLVAFMWLVIPFTFPGEPLLDLGPVAASRPGVALAAAVTLKSNAIVLAFMALVATMPCATLGYALHRLGVPDKLAHLLLMTYRYIFLIEQEYQRLLRAARIRGFRPATRLHTYRTFGYLVGMLFVRAADRAERVRWAMLCRGFKRRFHCLQEFRAGAGSYALFFAVSAAALAVIVLELCPGPP